jgi:hypothetical protein
MSNVLKCRDCGKTIIAEEEHTHKCAFGITEIPVIYYYELVKDGESVIVAKGKNGRYFRLVAKSPTGTGQPGRPTVNGTI